METATKLGNRIPGLSLIMAFPHLPCSLQEIKIVQHDPQNVAGATHCISLQLLTYAALSQPRPPLSPPQSHHPEQASHSLNLIFAQLTFLIWYPFSLRAPFTFPWKHLSLCVIVQLCNYSFDFSLPY